MDAPWGPGDWERFLATELAREVRVTYGASRTVPVQSSARIEGGLSVLAVRMHRMFSGAPVEVREATARWLKVGRRARRAALRLDAWIETALAAEPRPARCVTVEPRGSWHDLDVLAAPLFTGTFAADFGTERRPPALTWGRRGKSRGRRSLRLGSYDVESHVVRIHPVLDQQPVPPWFVRFVLMHEILHAAHPPCIDGGRWIHHGREFRARERAYADYARALRWEAENLPRLIEAARSGRGIRARRALVPELADALQLELS